MRALRLLALLTLGVLLSGCEAGPLVATPAPEDTQSQPAASGRITTTLDQGVLVPMVAGSQDSTGPNGGIAGLLRQRPEAGQSVEVDAYFSGAGVPPLPGQPAPTASQITCPNPSSAALTDQPFLAVLRILNRTRSNTLLRNQPWLVAAVPEAAQRGERVDPQLPYHARYRGHLGDPAFAQCPNADRIFVVEAVVEVHAEGIPDPSVYEMRPPPDYGRWLRYQDIVQNYSIPYPPDWLPLRLDDVTVKLQDPDWPAYPVTVRVYPEEIRYSEDTRGAIPAILQGESLSVFSQGLVFGSLVADGQGLAGSAVDRRAPGDEERSTSVLFPARGRTYEIALNYPIGFEAPQELLIAYSTMVEGFRLEEPVEATPEPTVTPAPAPMVTPARAPTEAPALIPTPATAQPARQSLGPGPFLNQTQILVQVRERETTEIALQGAALLPEAQARRQATICSTFPGRPDGVWVMTIRGIFDDQDRTMRLFIDATTGEQLCREEVSPATPPLLPTSEPISPTQTPPGPTPSPVPTQPTASGSEQPAVPPPPPAELMIGGVTQVAGIGTYCWTRQAQDEEGVGLCADLLGIPTAREPLLTRSSQIAVLRLPLEEPPSEIQVQVMNMTESEPLSSSPENQYWWAYQPAPVVKLASAQEHNLELRFPPGRYVLNVFARWEQYGDVNYGFLVEVVE